MGYDLSFENRRLCLPTLKMMQYAGPLFLVEMHSAAHSRFSLQQRLPSDEVAGVLTTLSVTVFVVQ